MHGSAADTVLLLYLFPLPAGLLTAVLRASLNLGIRPSRATLRAMLSCCADLDSRPGKTPMGLASGLGLQLQGLGVVDLDQVLAACEEAVEQQQQLGQALDVSRDINHSVDQHRQTSAGSSSSREVKQAAADLLRQWAFTSTFTWVDGVLSNGPTWALKQEAQLQSEQVLGVHVGSGEKAPVTAVVSY